MNRIIKGDEFVMKWAEALGIDTSEDKVRRVVIDASVGEALRVYVERYGTDRLLDVTPPQAGGVEITLL